MSNGDSWWDSPTFKVRIGILLVVLSTIARKFGDFCREASVLLVVFIPLDLWWRSQSNASSNEDWWGLGSKMLALFSFGVILELAALSLIRIKRDIEGKDGSDGFSEDN